MGYMCSILCIVYQVLVVCYTLRVRCAMRVVIALCVRCVLCVVHVIHYGCYTVRCVLRVVCCTTATRGVMVVFGMWSTLCVVCCRTYRVHMLWLICIMRYVFVMCCVCVRVLCGMQCVCVGWEWVRYV